MRPRVLRRRLILAGLGAVLAGGLIGACGGAATRADDGGPQDVRVQKYGDCLLFTHDSMQGASIAVWCSPGIQLVSP